jgi:hypothetical protein
MGAELSEQFDSRCDDDIDLGESAEHSKCDGDPCPPSENGFDVVAIGPQTKSAACPFSAPIFDLLVPDGLCKEVYDTQ